MKRVAVLGGGPAGATAAERLAAAGLDTVVIDEKLAWEKPCGGGITYKAYSQYPFLIDNAAPKRIVNETYLGTKRTGSVRLDLTRPLVVYSRYELNRLLLDRASNAGAQIEKARVLGITRRSGEWILRTSAGTLQADYCIVAMGARNPFREVGTEWTAGDTMCAMGYFAPADQAHIDIEFFPRFEGYIWVFPREGHVSAGICGKGMPSQEMRARLERYMREKGLPVEGSRFYGHVLPSLEKPAWSGNRVAGDGWMAVGDAAGLVDPVTGEGLYYAVRSGDLAARLLAEDRYAAAERPSAYAELLRHDFTRDLELASRLSKRLFLGKFVYRDVPARIIEFMRRSPTMCELMEDLFAGTQNYLELKGRLHRSLNGTLHELLMSFLFRRLIPSANQA